MTSRKRKRTDEDREEFFLKLKAIFCEPPSIVQHLVVLPPEILEKIFEYLSPEYLVMIQCSCKNSRVSEATALKKADFRNYKTATEAFMNLFFTFVRNSRLQELYLPQMMYMDGQTIFKYVSRCKFLTKLNISYKGLSYIKLLHILEKCKALKELHYYISSTSRENYEDLKTTHNLKKMCLYMIDYTIFIGMQVCIDLLSRCDSEAEVYLNCSYITSTFTFKIKPEEAKKHITDVIITNHGKNPSKYSEMSVDNEIYELFVDELHYPKREVKFSYEDPFHPKKEQRGFCVSLSKIYPILIKEKTSDVSSILPAAPLQTLVLIDPYCLKANEESERKFFDNLTEERSLNSLKHLTFFTSEYPDERYNRVLVSPFIVPVILSKCSYLQEVVLSRIHFDINHPSLFSLKHLKTLKLPPCAITPVGVELGLPITQTRPFLEDLAENCKYIESFSISSCYETVCCRDTLTDQDLMPIQKWLNLKHLSLESIRKVRTCSFLPRVAANTKLSTLCLIDVGPTTVCHYGSNLCYAIKLASDLQFLQISQKAFNPTEPLFWKNIAETKTLEGLCISCSHDAYLNSTGIKNSVEKLKSLHLFHLIAKNYPDCMEKVIRKVILGNGIKNPDIEVKAPQSFFFQPQCQFCHYPFIVPPYHHCLV